MLGYVLVEGDEAMQNIRVDVSGQWWLLSGGGIAWDCKDAQRMRIKLR
jgi:hypothetical protein